MRYPAGHTERLIARHDAVPKLRRRAIRVAVALAVAVSALTGGLLINQSYADTPPAATGTTADYTTDLLTTRIQATRSGGLTAVLKLPPRTMRAGERILLTTRLAGRSNAVRMPRMATRIDAVGPGETMRSPIASINHDGKAYGTQYVSVRWLFIAPTDGSYTITMRGEATTYLEPVDETQLTVVPDLTYLKVSNVGQTSVTWGDDHTGCVGAVAHPEPKIPECRTARSWTDALTQLVAKGTATTAVVIGDLELSREYGSYPGGTSRVQVTLQATPTAADGKPCAAKVSTSADVTITSTKHHWHQLMDLPVRISCGPKLWVKVTVKHLAGNPVGIEDRDESNGIALLS